MSAVSMKIPSLKRYIIGATIMLVVLRLCIIVAEATELVGSFNVLNVPIKSTQTFISMRSGVNIHARCNAENNQQIDPKDNKVEELYFVNSIFNDAKI